jgi:hypothetical protein
MIDKLGPALVWALYLSACYLIDTGLAACVFALCTIVALMAWVFNDAHKLGLDDVPTEPKVPKGPPHWDPIGGKLCSGVLRYVEHRKLHSVDGASMEVTRQCGVCKLLVFEKVPEKQA